MHLSKVPLLSLSVLILSSIPSQATVIMKEGFDNISTLPASGWTITNNSSPAGSSSWFQGDPVGLNFTAQSGPKLSYIAANFNNAAFGGNISNWLILPSMILNNGDTLTFWTRTEVGGGVFGDNLQVRLSANGNSANVGSSDTSLGDFVTLLTTVGSGGTYPESWTQFTSTVTGLSGPTLARFAFRYVVNDTSTHGDLIAIDSVVVDGGAVPEPSSLATLGAGLVLLAARLRTKLKTSA